MTTRRTLTLSIDTDQSFIDLRDDVLEALAHVQRHGRPAFECSPTEFDPSESYITGVRTSTLVIGDDRQVRPGEHVLIDDDTRRVTPLYGIVVLSNGELMATTIDPDHEDSATTGSHAELPS